MKEILIAFGVSFFALMLMLVIGCSNTTADVYIPNNWEGHYYTAEEAQAAAARIQLQKKQSVWILSNDTLNRTLKNVAERTQD